MKVLIVGCGYVGTALARKLISEGHEVWGLRRDAQALAKVPGIEPFRANLLDIRTLADLPKTDLVVLCQAPSRETDKYVDTYFRATQNLLAALDGRAPKKIIMLSSTSVYAMHDGSWVNESTAVESCGYAGLESAENARLLLHAEQLVLRSRIPAMILRLAGIYGPGRNRVEAIRSGRLKPAMNEAYTNRIHVDDIVSAIRVLADKGKPGEIYLGADDEPCTQSEFYGWLYGQLGVTPGEAGEPSEHSRHGGNKRCSNKKLKALGWQPRFANFRDGYTPLLVAP